MKKGKAKKHRDEKALNEELRACRKREQFDAIFDRYNFPKRSESRLLRLSQAAGVCCGDLWGQYSPSSRGYDALYEAFKEQVEWAQRKHISDVVKGEK